MPSLGWVHLLRTGRLDAATARRGLEAIDRNARLQAQLTADLLDVSKALTGKLRLNSRPAPLDDAVRQAIASAMPAARAKGVQLVLTQTEPAVVHGDPTRLRQIAWQLIANAIKFTPRGGTIEVATHPAKDEAVLRVQDSGQGIDPAFLPRVFERFTQADSSATRTAGGLGVGLALVRELVELHGGEIEARNRPDRNGAVFTVKLPLQALRPRSAATLSSSADAPIAGRGAARWSARARVRGRSGRAGVDAHGPPAWRRGRADRKYGRRRAHVARILETRRAGQRQSVDGSRFVLLDRQGAVARGASRRPDSRSGPDRGCPHATSACGTFSRTSSANCPNPSNRRC